MNLGEVERLINNLSWDLPEKVQLSSIKSLMEIDNEYIPLLIQDNKKNCWNNAVKVIDNMGYPRNKLALPRLIWLMQDMNWPGVPMAIEILKGIDKKVIIPSIEGALSKAAEDKDYMWMGGIHRLINELNISEDDFNQKEIYQFLKLADW